MFRKHKQNKISKVIKDYIVERQEAGAYVDREYIESVVKYVLRKLKEKEND